MDDRKRRKIIDQLSHDMGMVFGHEDEIESVMEFYEGAFNGMTDKELLRVQKRMSTYNSRQRYVAHLHVVEATRKITDASLRSKYVCFIFDTVIWALWFSEGHMTDRLVQHITRDNAWKFFDPKANIIPDGILQSNLWLEYSLGFMIEAMVTFENHTPPSGLDHMLWIGYHVEELQPHREIITSRRDISRDFCENLLGNASPALIEGVL